VRDWNDGHMGDGWGVAMALGMIGLLVVLVAVVVIAVVWATRSTQGTSTLAPPAGGSPSGHDAPSAKSILDERLARGEIEPDEYRARLDALTSGSQA
jgi:putative membrane protein